MTESVEHSSPPLYIFLDEGGNFDFSANGTKYVTLTCVSGTRPFPWFAPLADLRYDLLEAGWDLERFHASEDHWKVRQRAFNVISSHMTNMRVDSLIVEKRKTAPSLQPIEVFYPRMLGYLLKYVIEGGMRQGHNQVLIITDTLPLKKKRNAIRKGIQMTLPPMLPDNVTYEILHHASQSCVGLQLADYANWAIYRKWQSDDDSSYKRIQAAIVSEFEIFRSGKIQYY
jgi:hypothetical protein